MSRTFKKSPPLFFEDMREGLETLRSRLTDLEAATHGAAETTAQIPFWPRFSGYPRGESKPAWTDEDRRNLICAQSYVIDTANAAKSAFAEVFKLINVLDRSGKDDDGGGNGNSGGGRKGSSGAHEAGTSAVPVVVEPEVTKPYPLSTTRAGGRAVPPARSGGFIVVLPKSKVEGTMFQTVYANMFTSKADALVNPVHCVGTMGAGVARGFRDRFPRMYAAYLSQVADGEIRLGEVTSFWEHDRLIVNFPTKNDWPDTPKLVDIESGLRALRELIIETKVTSVAIPALGCDFGGLSWNLVEPRIRSNLQHLDIRIELYPDHRQKNPFAR